MRKIIYRGSEQIFRIQTESKEVYVFEESNGFAVLPSSWADYYEIISFDSTHKALVDAKDPLAETNMRRKSQFDYEVPVEIYEAQIERDKKTKEDKVYKDLVTEYKRGIYDQIASGVLEAIPDTIEEDAIAYADRKTSKVVVSDEVFPLPPVEEPTGLQTTVEEYIESVKDETKVEDEIVNPEGDTIPTTPTEEPPPTESTDTPTEEISIDHMELQKKDSKKK